MQIHSLGILLGNNLLFVFQLTNAQLHLRKRKIALHGSTNAKYVVGAFYYLNCLKKRKWVSCPSYEINAETWVLIIWFMLCMNIDQNNKLLLLTKIIIKLL